VAPTLPWRRTTARTGAPKTAASSWSSNSHAAAVVARGILELCADEDLASKLRNSRSAELRLFQICSGSIASVRRGRERRGRPELVCNSAVVHCPRTHKLGLRGAGSTPGGSVGHECGKMPHLFRFLRSQSYCAIPDVENK
jgi:hypothetical protein